ncbi:MAG: hypothetical protein GW947_03540 [Candidatus Pacebacteria bacterium]|nr:hypothetical protein [Candidatus Paceibacterota bacterium]PIR59621.1 MAG: hypothetical protein COU68_04570 [Candidatus Pacebacteria bacterium CG10_big_fil_rev_8_21_14_0_10_45_6]
MRDNPEVVSGVWLAAIPETDFHRPLSSATKVILSTVPQVADLQSAGGKAESVYFNGKMLPVKPCMLAIPSGVVDDDPKASAHRELWEELGVRVSDGGPDALRVQTLEDPTITSQLRGTNGSSKQLTIVGAHMAAFSVSDRMFETMCTHVEEGVSVRLMTLAELVRLVETEPSLLRPSTIALGHILSRQIS